MDSCCRGRAERKSNIENAIFADTGLEYFSAIDSRYHQTHHHNFPT